MSDEGIDRVGVKLLGKRGDTTGIEGLHEDDGGIEFSDAGLHPGPFPGFQGNHDRFRPGGVDVRSESCYVLPLLYWKEVPAEAPDASPRLKRAALFRGSGKAVMRTGFEDMDDLQLMVQCQSPQHGHSQADVGNFTLNAFGEKADPVIPPARSTSQITSEATVPNGHTIIVGGLQSSNLSESVDKVPLLGDIPILGLAFRNTISRKQYITTYLFITTTIMKSEDFADLKQISDHALMESSKSGTSSHVPDTEPNDVSPPEDIAEDPDRNPDL